MWNWEGSLSQLKGIGPKSEEAFRHMGIFTPQELLRCYPVAYDLPEALTDLDEAPLGVPTAVRGVLLAAPSVRGFGRNAVLSVRISDGTGKATVSFFHMPYLKSVLNKGDEKVFRGQLENSKYGLRMTQPRMYEPEAYEGLLGTISPVYPTAEGLSQKKLSDAVRQLLEHLAGPEGAVLGLDPQETEALRKIHFPGSREEMEEGRALLVYREFLSFCLGIRLMKHQEVREANPHPMTAGGLAEALLAALPYRLTGAQQRVWEEIRRDMGGPSRMNRLVQGDVGSGKTVLAFLAMLTAAENGCQAVLMAPTEVLAGQHFDKLSRLAREAAPELRVVLLTGSLKESVKKVVREEIREGRAQLIVGTHALIQEAVEYQRLGLVITDEQHRFGVKQRETLAFKGEKPHILVMSATPIPRTLAVILYGDLDISRVDELPANRKPIQNAVVSPAARGSAYRLIQKEIGAGHQAYVICPLVEASEEMRGENVEDYCAALMEIFPAGIRIESLNGRMKAAAKNDIMERFLKGEIDILVSTTVVEVGVDARAATVMLIEDADRFGLAQLHQLRGRVGRGDAQSYCIFVDGSGNQRKKERLEALLRSNDGFALAEEDLRLRGPGDLFGIRQSGDLHFLLGDIYRDQALLLKASEDAANILAEDPELKEGFHPSLRRQISGWFRRETL